MVSPPNLRCYGPFIGYLSPFQHCNPVSRPAWEVHKMTLESDGCPFEIVHTTRKNLHKLNIFGGRFGDRLSNMWAKDFAVCSNSSRCNLHNVQKNPLENCHFGNQFEINIFSDLLDRDTYTFVTISCIGLTHILQNMKSFDAFVSE